MKRIYQIACLVLVLSAAIFSRVEATVGGPTNIYDFKYNHLDESVYFIQTDGGGRGCPPLLKKMSLNSGEISSVFSCDEAEKITGGSGDKGYLINIKISDLTKDLKNLTPINLKKNNFEIRLSFLKDNYIGEEEKFKISSSFLVSILQNNKKIKEFEVSGCSTEQPFIFDGYAIPGFDQKIILLMSAKGDCFEGGYVSDSIFVVGGVGNLDKTYYSSGYKGLGSIQPGEGSLIVYPNSEEEIVTEEVTNDEAQEKSRGIEYLIAGVIFIAGLLVGKASRLLDKNFVYFV